MTKNIKHDFNNVSKLFESWILYVIVIIIKFMNNNIKTFFFI